MVVIRFFVKSISLNTSLALTDLFWLQHNEVEFMFSMQVYLTRGRVKVKL